MNRRILSILVVFAMLFALGHTVCFGAEGNTKILFSETFEGDLSRWYCDVYRESISLEESEDEYIGSYLSVKHGETQAKVIGRDWYVPFSDDCSVYSQSIAIDATKNYTFAVDFKSGDSQQIYVGYYNETGELVHNQSYTLKPESKDEWSCFSVELGVPDTAAQMQIVLSCRADRERLWEAHYDNVIICEGRVGFNKDIEKRKKYAPLAADSSDTVFERENGVFLETFENMGDEWTYLNNKSDNSIKTTKDLSSTGRKSLYVKDELMESPVGMDSREFDVFPGGEYTLSFDAVNYVESGVTVYIRFLSESGKVVKSASASGASKHWTNYSVSAVAPDDGVKAQIRIISKDYTGKNYVDNIKVVLSKAAPERIQPSAEEKIEELTYDEVSKNSIQLFIGSPNAIVNGEKTLIDVTNDKVVAGIVDSRTLVPVRFIAENCGAEVFWEDTTKTVTLKLPDKTVTVVLNENEINIDGKKIEIDVPAQSIEGRTMLPLRAFVEEVMNKTVFWDSRGLIVITDGPILDGENDIEIINALIDNISA